MSADEQIVRIADVGVYVQALKEIQANNAPKIRKYLEDNGYLPKTENSKQKTGS